MRKQQILFALTLLMASKAFCQENSTVLLPTLEEGPWPCTYYILKSNEQLSAIGVKEWAGICVNEEEWCWGEGPFSNSPDQFLTTEWGSEVHPLCVRRHFNMTAADLENLALSKVKLRCSYDENPRVYLNGKFVWSAQGWNDNDYAEYELNSRQRSYLREGDNVLAVALQAGNGGGHIDYGLQLISPQDTEGVKAVETESVHGPSYDMSGRCAAQGQGLIIEQGKKYITK